MTVEELAEAVHNVYWINFFDSSFEQGLEIKMESVEWEHFGEHHKKALIAAIQTMVDTGVITIMEGSQ